MQRRLIFEILFIRISAQLEQEYPEHGLHAVLRDEVQRSVVLMRFAVGEVRVERPTELRVAVVQLHRRVLLAVLEMLAEFRR